MLLASRARRPRAKVSHLRGVRAICRPSHAGCRLIRRDGRDGAGQEVDDDLRRRRLPAQIEAYPSGNRAGGCQQDRDVARRFPKGVFGLRVQVHSPKLRSARIQQRRIR